jgi:hypothetical protein
MIKRVWGGGVLRGDILSSPLHLFMKYSDAPG